MTEPPRRRLDRRRVATRSIRRRPARSARRPGRAGRSTRPCSRSGPAWPPHRRRLWLRRIVRRTWIALAVLLRSPSWPSGPSPGSSRSRSRRCVAALIPLARRRRLARRRSSASRPSLGETALAVDAEGRLGDRVSSALELAVAFPASAGPLGAAAGDGPDARRGHARSTRPPRPTASSAASDAMPWSRCGPSRPCSRHAGRGTPPSSLVVASLALVPVLALPNPQDAVIAQQREIRDEAAHQAERLEALAHDLESKGADAQDPRTRLAQELRDLARQLRERPGELDTNLAQDRHGRGRGACADRPRRPSSGRRR